MNEGLESLLHKTIKKVGEDIVALKFNTAISALMIFLNAVEKEGGIGKGQYEVLLRLLAPFAPHMAEELWSYFAKTTKDKNAPRKSIHLQVWPEYDEAKLVDEHVTIAVQINGKTRGEVQVATDASKDAQAIAAKTVIVARLEGKNIVRTIVVPGRLVNFVIEE